MAYQSVLPRLAAIGIAAALVASCNQGKQQAASSSTDTNSSEASDQFPDWAAGAAPAPQAKVDQKAVQAIQDMSRYLMSLNTFQLATVGSMDVVTADGQRIQMDGTTDYKVKRPGFIISYRSDKKNRDFYYDGKQFTVYSPNLGFYGTVPAPPTNREVLDTIYNKFGIRLPLEDLFRWNDSGAKRISNFRAAYDLGTVTLGGVKTTHYAFREPDVDWEIWIDDGAKPLPRKLSIVDRTDPARPAFTTNLKWTVNPTFNNSEFTFKPDADAKKIQLAEFKG